MSTGTESPLVERMRALADTGHDRANELRWMADKLDAAIEGAYATPPTKTVPQLVGSWARARRLWCEITGEDLV